MKPFLILLVSSLLAAQNANLQNPSLGTLRFADEFNGTELDLARWSPHHPLRRPDDQTAAAGSPQVGGGQLHLGPAPAAISTFGTFAQTYGRFEIRCKLPAGRGFRPGFKLLPVTLGSLPEIDVFGLAGDGLSSVSFENRWGTEQTARSFGDSITAAGLSTDFHTIAVEWEPDSIVWFLDGKEKFRSVDGIPHQPMYLLIYLDVIHFEPDNLPFIPAPFDIEYIRVYGRR